MNVLNCNYLIVLSLLITPLLNVFLQDLIILKLVMHKIWSLEIPKWSQQLTFLKIGLVMLNLEENKQITKLEHKNPTYINKFEPNRPFQTYLKNNFNKCDAFRRN